MSKLMNFIPILSTVFFLYFFPVKLHALQDQASGKKISSPQSFKVHPSHSPFQNNRSPQTAKNTISREIKSYLNKIPEKKLTVPFIVKSALEKSLSFKLLGYDYASSHLEEQERFDSITDTYFVAGTQYQDDNRVQSNPFRPQRTKNLQWSLGIEKNWETGTKTSLLWKEEDTELDFARNLGSFGRSFLRDFKQSFVTLQIEQNLLKDYFGWSFRQKRQGARYRAEALESKVRDDTENLVLVFVNNFYRAWLLQNQIKTLQNRLKRQGKMMRIMKRKRRKGAVEKSDLISLEALMASTSSRMELTKADLTQIWEGLIFNLSLPNFFFQVSAMDVPMEIDEPVSRALKACETKAPQRTAGIQALEKKLKAFESDFKASKNESLPDLKLIAGYQGNSIENNSTNNFRNILRGLDDNGFGRGPSWNLGLKLIWPLNNSGARAKRNLQHIERKKASAQLKLAKDNLKTTWKDLCRKLKTENQQLKIYRKMVKRQKNRMQIEQSRFSLGKIGVNQWVVAEDDLDQWEFNKDQKSIEIRQLAWQVQKNSGDLYKQLSPLISALMMEQ